MKKIMLLFFSFIVFKTINAQVGIGTNTPNSSAALDVSDSTRGLLIPRMTMAKRQAILNPAEGLLIYQTDNTPGLWFYNGLAWSNLNNAGFSGNTAFTHQVKSTTGNITVVYTNSNAYAFCDDAGPGPAWYPIALTGIPLGAIAVDNVVMLYTATAAFAFSFSGAGASWSTQPITGTPKGLTANHDIIVLSTTTNLYGRSNTSWSIQPVSGIPVGSITGETNVEHPVYCIIVYTTSFAYALRSGSSQWFSQALSGTPLGGSAAGYQMLVYTSTNAYAFEINGTPSPWHPLSLSGTVIGSIPE